MDPDRPRGIAHDPSHLLAAVPAEADVRATDRIRLAGDWSLVLHATGIDHRIHIRDGRIVISVAAEEAGDARAALDAFDVENAVVPEPPLPDLGPTPLGLGFAVLLVAVHVALQARGVAPPWVDAGSASAEAIVAGEWWRTITALTLHADVVHLAGNVIASLLFVSAVGRWLGAGLGGAVILLAGAGGNLITAHAYGARHDAIGASTATFAALGVLAALQMLRHAQHRDHRRRWRAWFPLAAGLGLVVMLGMSERADVVAHLSGLATGVLFGFVVWVIRPRAPGAVVQAALAMLTVAMLVAAWGMALRG